MRFATHNSGTGEKLVWWQRPFGAILNATSRCQDMTIKEQLEFGVKYFNLQITMYNGEWVFSHGLCVYNGKLHDALNLMTQYASEESPIYYQLYLDKNFFLGQKKDEFRLLVNELVSKSNNSNVKIDKALIEGTEEYPYKSGIKLDCYESYWTKSWAKYNAKSWIDKLPLPKRWAKLHNQEAYDKGVTHQFFMGDFVNHYISYNYIACKEDSDKEIKLHLSVSNTTTANPTDDPTDVLPPTITNTPTNTPSVEPHTTIVAPTVTPTQTHTSASNNELILKYNGRSYVFTNGLNFGITINKSENNVAVIDFDIADSYDKHQKIIAISDNTSIVRVNLSTFYKYIKLMGFNTGRTKIYISTTIDNKVVTGYIIISVVDYIEASPTVSPTQTIYPTYHTT